MVGFVYSVFLSSVSVQKALWKERSDFGGPRLRQVRKLGKSKYDHTMGGNQGEWARHLHRIPRLSEAPWEVP